MQDICNIRKIIGITLTTIIIIGLIVIDILLFQMNNDAKDCLRTLNETSIMFDYMNKEISGYYDTKDTRKFY